MPRRHPDWRRAESAKAAGNMGHSPEVTRFIRQERRQAFLSIGRPSTYTNGWNRRSAAGLDGRVARPRQPVSPGAGQTLDDFVV